MLVTGRRMKTCQLSVWTCFDNPILSGPSFVLWFMPLAGSWVLSLGGGGEVRIAVWSLWGGRGEQMRPVWPPRQIWTMGRNSGKRFD